MPKILALLLILTLSCSDNSEQTETKHSSSETRVEPEQKGILHNPPQIFAFKTLCFNKQKMYYENEETNLTGLLDSLKVFFRSNPDQPELFYNLQLHYDLETFDFPVLDSIYQQIKALHRQHLNELAQKKFSQSYEQLSKEKKKGLGFRLLINEMSYSELKLDERDFTGTCFDPAKSE